MSKFQLHVSGLTMLSRCGEQFRRRYIEGERVMPGVGLVTGKAVHRSVEEDLRNKLAVGTLLDDEAVADIARDAVEGEWLAGVELKPDELERGERTVHGEAVDFAVSLAGKHHTAVAPAVQPTHVERKWVVEVKGYGFQLAGAIDIQEDHPRSDATVFTRIADTKTTRKTPGGNPAEGSIQLTCYSLAVLKHDGRLPDEVRLDYLVGLKRETKYKAFVSTRTAADFTPFLDRVAVAHRGIESGIFQPANPDDWWCDARFCGYYGSCRYVRRPVSSGPQLIQIEGAAA